MKSRYQRRDVAGMGLHLHPYKDRNVRTVASIQRVPLGKFPVKPWG